MYLLDTDHISLIDRGGTEGRRIIARLAALPSGNVFVCIVNYEEQMRGWLAEIGTIKVIDKQIPRYAELQETLGFYCNETILPFR